MKTPDAAAPRSGRDRERLLRVPAILRAAGAVRHVGYADAEEDCRQLARILLQCTGDGLDDATFRAVPRGGFIVLGMLSYWLDLGPRQLRPEPDARRPLVLVDDCAFSGARLRRELAQLPQRQPVTVALLHAPQALCQAVERAEPRVERCIAARHLADLTRDVLPGESARRRWRDGWDRRLGPQDPRYWLGVSEGVTFAWSEPDRPFWNESSGRVESGWHLVPPHRCLKSRAQLAGTATGVEPPRGDRRWRLPAGVVWGEFDGVLWLVREKDEQVFSLNGAAAAAWKALVGGTADAAAVLVRDFEVDAETAERDVERLTTSLQAAGVLEACDASACDEVGDDGC